MVAVASAKPQPLAPNLPSHRDPYYGGRWQKPKSPRYVDTISPGTGEPLGKVVDGSAADAEAAIAAAKAAFREWRRVAPLERAKMIDELPVHEDLGLPNARLVAPGSPESSVLYQRITRRGEKQMPPVSTNLVDEQGARLIKEWILSLPKARPQERPLHRKRRRRSNRPGNSQAKGLRA